MSPPILATKLYIPPPRPGAVPRPRLIERLNEGLRHDQGFARRLTLISAPAGFGKTALVGQWVAGLEQSEPKTRVVWLSLEEADGDPARFLAYLIAAVQPMAADFGASVLLSLQGPQPPPLEAILTALLNEIAAVPTDIVLVLDDYHLVDSQPVDQAVAFLVEHLPPRMHLAIATREDPPLPLARLRGRGQLAELRAADLRFTSAEAAEFLNRVMGLDLSAEDVAALEDRTEGWIAGLQLAALALQGASPTQPCGDRTRLISEFTGSHHFVLDYLLEEVLEQQPAGVQSFLLRTSILDRLCGPLCESVAYGGDVGLAGPAVPAGGQQTLEYLERANLFTVPLDNERRWYRYHHLFADLLRQRLGQYLMPGDVAALHLRASEWCEAEGLALEAFRHAAAANDVERAERLIEGKGLHLHFRGVAAIRDWLASLPNAVLDARPSLWVRAAMSSLVAGQAAGVEEKLQAAEAALQDAEPDDSTRDLIGQIAAARATLAGARYQPDVMIGQARRALEYLHPDNLSSRCRATWTVGTAYRYQGEREAAARAYTEALSIARASGSIFSIALAQTCLGEMQELGNRLYAAAENYRQALQLLGDQPRPVDSDTYLGLARICYQWDELDAAEGHGQQALQLARQYDPSIDRFVASEVFLARLKLARGDPAGASAMLAETERSARQRRFLLCLPEIAAAQVPVLLRQGQVAAAAQLARQHELPLVQARVLVAQGDATAALAVLDSFRRQAEARGWADERLNAMVLQAVALQAHAEKGKALQVLSDALTLAEPGGFIRLFVDEGDPMAHLLSEAAGRLGPVSRYAGKLLAAFGAGRGSSEGGHPSPAGALVEPLSQRELDVLRLIAQGLSNQEIGVRLFLALNTVKGHNRVIFDKLQVERRTEAVARGRELGLL